MSSENHSEFRAEPSDNTSSSSHDKITADAQPVGESNSPDVSQAVGSESVENTVQVGDTAPSRPGISRRSALIRGGMATAFGLGIGAAGGYYGGKSSGYKQGETDADVLQVEYPFRGEHQPGIITPQQQQMMFAAYDVITEDREQLIEMLKTWTRAAENFQAGRPVSAPTVSKLAAPQDTGETYDLGPGALTVTFGFGETLFEKEGEDRFGLKQFLPEPLKGGIPRMAAEKLDQAQCYGDIMIQACAEDPMIAMHAIHNLTRLGFGRVSIKYSQLGYGRTSSTSTGQQTPRNLFGFKDGTSNIKAEDGAEELNEHLWIQPGDSQGDVFAGGSYLCIRKIYQMMEIWDGLVLQEQEDIVGRDKLEGAPQSGGTEFTPPDFSKTDENGKPLIPVDSHLAVVHPDHNDGHRMLRRGYNYMEGTDELGRLQGGLFFIAYVRDPQTGFIPILRKMSDDALTEYLQHVGTSLWVIPPGVQENEEYVGQKLFEA